MNPWKPNKPTGGPLTNVDGTCKKEISSKKAVPSACPAGSAGKRLGYL